MEVIEKWMKYCNANGIEREGAATRLGIDIFTYNRILSGPRTQNHDLGVAGGHCRRSISCGIPHRRLDRQDDVAGTRDGHDDRLLQTRPVSAGHGSLHPHDHHERRRTGATADHALLLGMTRSGTPERAATIPRCTSRLC